MAEHEDGVVEGDPAARAKPGHVDDDLPPHTDDAQDGAKSDAGAADGDLVQQGSPINFAQFNSHFTAPGAMFGMGMEQAAVRRRATGWVDAAEIDATLKYYVHPRPCFDRAAAALEDDRVVVLTATTGSGKRSGAIALVTGFAERDRCVVLSPDLALEELAKRNYETGSGYVLLDRVNEPVAQLDFSWRQVRDRVRAHGAYLVVTSVHEIAVKPESVQHIDWRTPEPKHVLQERLRDCEAGLIDEALTGMPGDCTLRDVVAVANLIVSGVSPRDAWEEHGGSAVQVVSDWFAKASAPSDYTAMTTLAFAVGSNRRTFETLQRRLEDRLAPEPAPSDSEEKDVEPEPVLDPIYDGRRALKDHPLVTTKDLPVGTITRSVLVFADPRYRQWVLEALWETCQTPFWDAVRDWLTEVVASNTDPQLEFAIATGLAQLARITFDEVVESYLDPWAYGTARAAGKALAVQVLWCMSLDEELAGAALSEASGWIDRGPAGRRSTGVVAFGGMLGVRFPSDAVRRLWDQVEHGGSVSAVAQQRLGYLFAALVECDEDATVVTKLLKHRLRKQRRTATTDVLKRYTFQTVLGLLQFQDWNSDQPVCAVALVRQPALTTHLAELFAGVLVNRPYRNQGKDALMKMLKALPAVCADAREVACRFGHALGAALPADERQTLVDGLRIRRDTYNNDLAGAFLSAVLISEDEAIHG